MLDQLKTLESVDTATKPANADTEWSELSAYYEDQSRAATISHLQKLGAGLGDNKYPIDLASILKRLIDGGATIYNRPPARFLSREGARLEESSEDHEAMLSVYEAARVDVALKEIDRKRALVGQMCVRIYPDDARKSVTLRSFHPQHVLRDPNPATSDLMDHDRRFGLRMTGDIYEYWHRVEGGAWAMVWIHERQGVLPPSEQPFSQEDGYLSPYSELPVQMIYSDYTGGRPWIAPRQSRQGFVRSLTAMANNVHELTHLQAHNMLVYLRDDPSHTLPTENGPSVVMAIDTNEDIKSLPASPALAPSLEVVQTMLRLFSVSEYQAGDEFSADQQIQTGAAQRVKMQALYDRRRDQVPLAAPDESALWRRIRAVHNEHASSWGAGPLASDTEIEIELRNLDVPSTETEAGNAIARDLALGARSVIDWIMDKTGCTRPQAIDQYNRVKLDGEMYPPPVAQEPGKEDGPRMTEIEPGPTAPDEQPDVVLDGKASVADALKAVG